MCCHGNQNHEVWMAVHLNCQLFQGGTENREIMNETRSDPSVCGWNKVIVRKKYCPGQGDFPVRQATFYSHFLMGKNPGKWSAHWTKKYITCPCKQNFRGAFPKGKLELKFLLSPADLSVMLWYWVWLALFYWILLVLLLVSMRW